MTVPYINELWYIRRFLERKKGFPYNWCDRASRLVRKVVGLDVVTGVFSLDYRNYSHTCNIDLNRGLEVDLTADQFDSRYPPVLVQPIGKGKFQQKPMEKTIMNIDRKLKYFVEELYIEYMDWRMSNINFINRAYSSMSFSNYKFIE